MPSYQLPDGSRTSPDAPAGLTKQDIAEHYQGQHGTKLWLDQKKDRMKDVWWQAALAGIDPVGRTAQAIRDAVATGKLGENESLPIRTLVEGVTGGPLLAADLIDYGVAALGIGPPIKDPKTGQSSLPSAALQRVLDKYTTAPTSTAGKAVEFVGSMGSGAAALSRIPKMIATSPKIRELAAKGIVTTPGQRWSAIKNPITQSVSKLEEGLSRFPFVGGFIEHARGRSVADAARAQVDDALRIAGEPLASPKTAIKEAITDVHNKLDSRYSSLFSRMTGSIYQRTAAITRLPGGGTINVGQNFDDVLKGVQQAAQQRLVDPAQIKAVDILIADVRKHFDRKGAISGDAIKQLQRLLRDEESSYSTSATVAEQKVAPFITSLREGLGNMLSTANPAHAQELNTLDRSWRQYAMVRDASIKAPLKKEGTFTPTAMMTEVKKRAGEFEGGQEILREGTALGQPLAQTSGEVLGNVLPDSGTPYALLTQEALAQVLGHQAGGGWKTAAALAGVPAVYNRPVLKALQNRALSPYGNLGPLLGIIGGGREGFSAYKPQGQQAPANPLVPSDLSEQIPSFK